MPYFISLFSVTLMVCSVAVICKNLSLMYYNINNNISESSLYFLRHASTLRWSFLRRLPIINLLLFILYIYIHNNLTVIMDFM